jgi:uncharacterized protein YegL
VRKERLAKCRPTEPGQIVLPFYLVCGLSRSMRDDLHDLDQGVRRLRTAILAEPIVDDVAQLCILAFSDDARVLMPMGQLSAAELPALEAKGGTNYGAAFRELARVIERDRAGLMSQGLRVHQPYAFFLTDGEPVDSSWHRTFTSTLTFDHESGRGLSAHPVFVPFGFRGASQSVLKQLAYPPATGKWYHAGSAPAEQALAGILQIMTQTVLTTSRRVQTSDSADPHPDAGNAWLNAEPAR